MSQFDIHRNVDGRKEITPYVVVVQSRRFDGTRRRVVVPIVVKSAVHSTDPVLNPVFEIEGKQVVLNTLAMVSMPVERLGERIGSLAADGDRIIAAIDLLITRAWD